MDQLLFLIDSIQVTMLGCHNLVHSLIINLVLPSITQSIVHAELATAVWKNLKGRLLQGDLLSIAKLQQELYSFKQGTFLVTDFFTQLTIL